MKQHIENVHTVIWDLDGTLLDSFGIYEEALAEVAPQYGLDIPTRAALQANYHGSLEDSISAVLGGVRGKQLDAIVHDFLVIQNTQYAVIEGHLFKDAEDLVKRTAETNVRQVVVTNRDHEGRNNASPRSIVANSELRNYIDAVICGDDSGHRKPSAAVLGPFLDKYEPETTLVIGDQFVDAHFAYNLGSRAVLISRSGETPLGLDTLDHYWNSYAFIVASLDEVRL